jgi:hypothetical protein
MHYRLKENDSDASSTTERWVSGASTAFLAAIGDALIYLGINDASQVSSSEYCNALPTKLKDNE